VRLRSALPRFFTLPVADLLRGEGRCLVRPLDLGWLLAGLAVGWWVYVPLHELLHAAGCAAAGGAVTRLDVDPLYGGALLARLFPFVVAGGEYAGRLSGFDTGGSDLVYLVTDLAPFVLTLWPGVWALRLAARSARSGRAALFGAAAPFAFAPFLSLTGDAYEIGSILVTRLPPWSAPAASELLRGDDLLKVGARLAGSPEGLAAVWLGAALAAAVGVAWAFATYRAGAEVASRLGQPEIATTGRDRGRRAPAATHPDG
jgi:hypothetical protein